MVHLREDHRPLRVHQWNQHPFCEAVAAMKSTNGDNDAVMNMVAVQGATW
jgi:hypothetical protein